MRALFQKCLFLVMVVGLAVSSLAVFILQTRHAEHFAAEMIKLKIIDTINQIERTIVSTDELREVVEREALAKASAVSMMVELDPSLIRDRARMLAVRDDLNVNEINVSDAEGVLVLSTDPAVQGYDMKSQDQSRPFMGAVSDPKFSLAQAPQPRGLDKAEYQYVGVARRDTPGIVQIGYYPQRMRDTLNLFKIDNLSSGLRVAEEGSVLVFQKGVVRSGANHAWIGKKLAWFGLTGEEEEFAPLCVHAADGEMLSMLAWYGDYLVVGVLPLQAVYVTRNDNVKYMLAAGLFIFACLFVMISFLVDRAIIRGIYGVNASLKKITAGDLREQVNETGNPEFSALSEGINSMVAALRKQAEDERERIRYEMTLARAVQLGALPDVETVLPGRHDFSLSAAMLTAKAVGGDFYDFFPLGEDRVCLIIADVSGKGVPAALFMMTAKAHLKSGLESESDLGAALSAANAHLCRDNPEDMFVTVFAAVLHTSTGCLEWINAGHNPPYVAEGAHSPWDRLTGRRFPALGCLEDQRYASQSLVLRSGARLFLYTDGVTEALNPAGEFYGEARLKDFLRRADSEAPAPHARLALLEAELTAFMDGAEQADDITLLTLDYHRVPSAPEWEEREFDPVGDADLPNALAFVQEGAESAGLSPKGVMNLCLAVEELFVNIIRHAYGAGRGPARLGLRRLPDAGGLAVRLRDRGSPFNPLETPSPDIHQAAEERSIGGLGVFMARKKVDEMFYERAGEENILTVCVHADAAARRAGPALE
jgi:serine phosphatase RsbU (regulator of sigma subunit)/anti-sigma regulatory factor (Ser/Thr protein kinase)